jgi:hypothetical protein
VLAANAEFPLIPMAAITMSITTSMQCFLVIVVVLTLQSALRMGSGPLADSIGWGTIRVAAPGGQFTPVEPRAGTPVC